MQSRIQSLERKLRTKTPELAIEENSHDFHPEQEYSQLADGISPPSNNPEQTNEQRPDKACQDEQIVPAEITEESMSVPSYQLYTEKHRSPGVSIALAHKQQNAQQDITAVDMIQSRVLDPELPGETFPDLPSGIRARELVDTVYFYTQARYCIIDWAQLREWHRNREAIAFATTEDPAELQIGSCPT